MPDLFLHLMHAVKHQYEDISSHRVYSENKQNLSIKVRWKMVRGSTRSDFEDQVFNCTFTLNIHILKVISQKAI